MTYISVAYGHVAIKKFTLSQISKLEFAKICGSDSAISLSQAAGKSFILQLSYK